MTTRKELETIKNRVLKALYNESVTGHRIRIKTKEDSDMIFVVSDVLIKAETLYIDITDKSYVIHIMTMYEDITEISDRNTLEVMYEKVN